MACGRYVAWELLAFKLSRFQAYDGLNAGEVLMSQLRITYAASLSKDCTSVPGDASSILVSLSGVSGGRSADCSMVVVRTLAVVCALMCMGIVIQLKVWTPV